MALGRHSLSTPAQRRDLIRLVDIHHNAALLYVAQCLGPNVIDGTQEALSALIRQIHAMEDVDQWLHNLPWPLFMAGVESYGRIERQKSISDLYKRISKVIGLRQYHDMLTFLDTFWSGNEPDWQILARSWELSGRRVLAY